MIDLGPTSLLMIEPAGAATVPVVDELTRRLVAVWRKQRIGTRMWMGFHQCSCGAGSDTYDHYVTIGQAEYLTNSLCIHYVACHRADVPASELAKLALMPQEEVEPEATELGGMRVIRR